MDRTNKLLHVSDHALIKVHLNTLRDRQTEPAAFRLALKKVSTLLAAEVLASLATCKADVETPAGHVHHGAALEEDIIIVPIIRAGLGMVEGFYDLLDNVKTGHIGIYREPVSHKIKSYFRKMPRPQANSHVIIVDPMVASGASALEAINTIEALGFSKLTLVGLIGAKPGIELIQAKKPNLPIWLGALDAKLDAKGYIVPGLGDAGDRLFGFEE